MATIDGRYIFVEQEDPNYEVDVTEQPVENNVNLTDHVQRRARTMRISGMIVGDDAAEIKDYLIGVQDTGSIVEYDGRNYFVGLLTGFTTSHNYKVGNGFTFSASLQEVVVGDSSYIEMLPTPIRAETAPVISSGRKQTKTKNGKKDEPVQKVKFKTGSPWAEE